MNNNLNVQKNECSCNTENGKKIVEMLETERKRIVSELHDTSLQNIAHFVHMIELASLYIDKDPARAKMELNSVSKGLHNVIEDIRSTIFNLRPMTFDDLGLKASFERLLDFFFGLALTHEGVVLLNGTIHISSEIGKGTTIDIKIPLDLHLAEK